MALPDPVLPRFAPLVSGVPQVPVVCAGISVFSYTSKPPVRANLALTILSVDVVGGLEQTFDGIGEPDAAGRVQADDAVTGDRPSEVFGKNLAVRWNFEIDLAGHGADVIRTLVQ